jgi:hypothetical protein
MNDLTPDFRFRRSWLGGLARARLPNIDEINRKAAPRGGGGTANRLHNPMARLVYNAGSIT